MTYDVCCVIIYVYSGEKRELPQVNATRNPLNAYLPKIVDSTTPGLSYQLPSSWLEFIESVATNGRIE